MPDYLVVLRVSDHQVEFPQEATEVSDDLNTHGVSPDTVIGVFPIPKDNTVFCKCDRTSDKSQRLLGLFKGRRYKWTTCKSCKKPIKKWHHAPINYLGELKGAERLFLNWSPETTAQHRKWVRSKFDQWQRDNEREEGS